MIYGGDYNREQWAEEVWLEGCAIDVRGGRKPRELAIFSWAKWEPRPGEFHFSWFFAPLRELSVAVDLVHPTEELGGYEVVLAPALLASFLLGSTPVDPSPAGANYEAESAVIAGGSVTRSDEWRLQRQRLSELSDNRQHRHVQ